MRKITVTLLLTISSFVVFGQEMTKQDQKVVSNFIATIKYQKQDNLLNKVSFPFSREYPIPEIKDKQEFLNRYNEIFDDSLTEMIINSQPAKDWSAVGSHGIMLSNGEVWLDYDGGLLAVNYQSKAERKEKEKLIGIAKHHLYKSLRKFEQPICVLEAKKYRIRIDDLGKGNYRYASWSLKNKMSDKPDIVIAKGKYIPQGSGGNHSYKFKDDDYVYNCDIMVIGRDDTPPAALTIYKGSTEILSQQAKIIKR